MQTEAVRRLDDLLLRRLRIGLTAPEGGIPRLSRIRPIVQSELGWNDTRWQAEAENYRMIWRKNYSASEFDQSWSLVNDEMMKVYV